VQPYRDEQTDRQSPRIVPAALLLVVVLLLVAGCSRTRPAADPGAAGFFAPIGPLRLLQHTSAPESVDKDPTPAPPARLARPGQPTVPDSKIRLDVGMKLGESAFADERVDYVVDRQTVVLTGRVPTRVARDRIELIARSVDGVRAVVNHLYVDEALPEPDAGAGD
jgi:hypothetical protein